MTANSRRRRSHKPLKLTEENKPEPRKGARTIAKEHGIEKAYKTIINRYNDGRSMREAHEEQQKLTASEEAVLVDFLM